MNIKYVFYLKKFHNLSSVYYENIKKNSLMFKNTFKNNIISRVNKFEKINFDQRRLYSCKSQPDSINPFIAEVVVNEELHKGGKSSCRHIEFEITGSNIKYEPGDSLAIFAANKPESVFKIETCLKANLKKCFSSNYSPEENLAAKCTKPYSCTACQALTFYLDITSPPSKQLLRQLSECATDECESKRLHYLSCTTEDAIKCYRETVLKKYKTIVDILQENPSIRIDIIDFCHLLPKLQPRYYSISSSYKFCPYRISLTFEVLKAGLVTNWLSKKKPDDEQYVPIFVQESTFRLPEPKRPIVMICSGTGFAPFRSFIQERYCQSKSGEEVGKMFLFMGCTSRCVDFIYEDELKDYVCKGLLTLCSAFPKDDGVKIQDLVIESSEVIWNVLSNCGSIYVCGSLNFGRMIHCYLVELIKKCTNSSTECACAYLESLKTNRRYQTTLA